MPVEMQTASQPGVLVLNRTAYPTDLTSTARQQPIPSSKLPGLLTETFILPRSGEVFAKQAFDNAFRPSLVELGYTVLESSLKVEPVRLQWKKLEAAVGEKDVWDLWVIDGPARVIGQPFAWTDINPLYSQELRQLEAGIYIAVYSTLVCPNDGVFNDAKMQAVGLKQDAALKALGLGNVASTTSNITRAVNLHTVVPVDPPGRWLLWLTLLGIGAVGIASAAKGASVPAAAKLVKGGAA